MNDTLERDLQVVATELGRMTPAVTAAEASLRRDGVDLHLTSRMRTPRRVPLAIAMVACVAVAVGVVASRLAPNAEPQSPAATAGATGSWRQGAAVPFDAHGVLSAVPLRDDRVLVIQTMPEKDSGSAAVGGIYDPAADEWQILPPAPVSGMVTVSAAGNAVAVVSLDWWDPSQRAVAAVFDVTSGEWTPVDRPQNDATFWFTGWGWDGDTLAFVRAGLTPDQPGTEDRTTLRWSRSTQRWNTGAPFPMRPRGWTNASSAYEATDRVAIVGGLVMDVADGDRPVDMDAGMSAIDADQRPARGALDDGAVYDVAADRWTVLPPLPADGNGDGRAVGPRALGKRLVMVGKGRVTYVLSDGKWKRLGTPSAGGGGNVSPSGLPVISATTDSGPQPSQYLDPASLEWRDAPGRTVFDTASRRVALTATGDNPGGDAFGGWVLNGADWLPVVDAPFGNRMDPAIAAIGDTVVVIGGSQGTSLVNKSDVWILDLTQG